jgi:SPP1 family predicted phage head-tail adaptor
VTCCKYKAGDLNRKIDVNQPNNISDGQGGSSVGWTLFKSTWAKLEPMKGAEKVRSDRLTTAQMTKVIMRYDPLVTDEMQIVYNGEEYQIRSVVNINESNEWLELMIERVVAQ